MNQFLTFAFIGGDLRQIRVISRFAKEGYPVRTFGLEAAAYPAGVSVLACDSLDACIDGADIVVLPLPYTGDGETVKTAFSADKIHIGDCLRKMSKEQLLFAGRADDPLKTLAALYNVHLIDYMQREELAIQNSIPTVEGAIEIAMAETPYTIHNSRCLILGHGRIGKMLSQTLGALGAKVSVAARKRSDLAWIGYHGYRALTYADLPGCIADYDLIFNTVPHMVLDFKLLSLLSDSCLIIDLASAPGGVDFETAQKLGINVIWALSLPGKVAPQTAGDIIKDTISNILEELGV